MNTTSIQRGPMAQIRQICVFPKLVARLLTCGALIAAYLLASPKPGLAQCSTNISVTITLTAANNNGTHTVSLAEGSASVSQTYPCGQSDIPQLSTNSFTVVLQPYVKYTLYETWVGPCPPRYYEMSNSCSCLSLTIDNSLCWGTETNGGCTYDLILVGTNRVLCTPETIPPDNESTTTAYAEEPWKLGGQGTNISWEIIDPDLGCKILSIAPDGFSCVIQSGTNKGSITIVANGTNNCPASGTLELKGCESCAAGSCANPGNTSPGLENGINYGIAMGAFGREGGAFLSAGELEVSATLPSAQVFTPSSLSYSFPSKGAVVTNAQGIKQVKTPQAIAVVTTNSVIKYTITIYSVTNISGYANGAHTITSNATAITAITVENADGTGATSNSVRITSVRDGNTYIQDYVYSSSAWQLTTGGGARTEFETITTTNSVRTVLHEIKAGSTVLRSSTRRYQAFSWGEGLIESIEGTGADARTNSYTYNTNGWIRQVNRADGLLEIYVYDNFGRPTNIFSAWLNQEPTTNGSLCRVITNIYSSSVVSGSGDNTNTRPHVPRLTVESILGIEVSRRYQVHFPGTAKDIRCVEAGATWDDTDNLVTIERFYTNGAFQRMLLRVIRPDWTMDAYGYQSNATTFTTTVQSGRPDFDFVIDSDEDSEIWFGTAMTNVTDQFGLPVSRTVLNLEPVPGGEGSCRYWCRVRLGRLDDEAIS